VLEFVMGEPSWPPLADCGPVAPDAVVERVVTKPEWDPARVIIVGEVHGRLAAPCVVEALARRLIAEGRPVAFGFEDEGDPPPVLASIKEAVAREDIDGALARILATPSWAVRPHDGRESRAVYRLYRFAFTEVSGAPHRVDFINHDALDGGQEAKRNTMTRRLAELVSANPPPAVTLALVGNNWTGGHPDSICAHLTATTGVDPLCLEVGGPLREAVECGWEMGRPEIMDMIRVAGQPEPVDYVLRTYCDEKVGPAVAGAAAP